MKIKSLENNENYKFLTNKEEEKAKPKINFFDKYSIIMLLILEVIFLIMSVKSFSCKDKKRFWLHTSLNILFAIIFITLFMLKRRKEKKNKREKKKKRD